jgi:hypothetical protein
MIRKFLLTTALAVTAALAAPSASQAAFTLTINGTTITDGGAGDLDPTAGVIFYTNNAGIDGYRINGITATTTSPTSIAGLYTVQVAANVRGLGTQVAPLVITSDSDGFAFTGGVVTVLNSLSQSAFTSVGGSATGTTNITAGGTTPVATILSGPTNSDSTSLVTSTGVSFSLSNTLTITGLTGLERFNGTLDSDVRPTPAPAGLILAALGLPAFGLLRRKFSKVVA